MQDKNIRSTFNQAALDYDKARPGYPDELIKDVLSLSGIPPKGRIIEVGCGTGQATLPLAELGYSLDCLDIGKDLVALAKEKCRTFPKVSFQVISFEDYSGKKEDYDLLIFDRSFHSYRHLCLPYPCAQVSLLS